MRVALVALLAVLAGCTVTGGTTGAPETVTPAPVPTADGGRVAPGVTNDTVVDAAALAAAHERAATGRAYTLTTVYAAGSHRTYTRIAVEGSWRYRYRSNTSIGGRDDRTFVDGQTRYSRYRRPLGVEYVRAEAVPADERFGAMTAHLVRTYLGIGTADVQALPDGSGHVVTITHADPPGLDGRVGYAARAVVDPSGFVRSLAVTYRNRAGNTTVSHRYTYTNLGGTTVDRPGWVRAEWGNGTGV